MSISTQRKRQSWLNRWTRRAWLEIEAVAVNLTGPALLVGSVLQAIAYFENQALLVNDPWIVNAWAIARAAGVVLWPIIGVGYLRRTLKSRGNPIGWLLLIGGLGLVELQIGMTFYSWTSHQTDWGWLGFLNIPGVELAGEYVILGIVLTIVGRIIMDINEDADQSDQQADQVEATVAPALTAESLAAAITLAMQQAIPTHNGVRPNLQPVAPVASPAYWHGPLSPISDGGYTTGGERVTFVSEDEPGEEPPEPKSVTHHTRPRRRDSGRSSLDTATKKAHMLALLTEDPAISLKTLEEALELSRPTTVKYRDEIRRRLWVLYPERQAEFSAAWGGQWADRA